MPVAAGMPSPPQNGQLLYAAAARSVPPGASLPIEPDVFHAPAVVDAVAHDRQTFHIGLPAIPRRRIEDDRPRLVLCQFLLDLPHQAFALVLVGLDRLPVDHLVEFGIAIAIVVALGP